MHDGAAAGDRKPSVLTGIFLLLPITMAVMGIVLLAPVLPQLQNEFKSAPYGQFLIPMVLTTPALCITLFSWLAGAVGDRIGRRRLLILAMLIYAPFGVAPIFLHSLPAILASRVGVGLAEAMVVTLSTALIGDYYKGAERDRWLASQTAVASLSALLLFNVGGFLGGYGWRAPFAVYGSSLIMLLGVLAFTWEPTADQTHDVTERPATSWGDFPWLWMAGVVAVTVFGSVMFYTVQIQASVGLTELGVTDPRRIGFLTSIASLGVPVGTIVFRRLVNVRVAALLALEFAVLGVGFVLMTRGGSATLFLVGCALNQFGAGLVLPTLLTWAMRGLPFAVRGRGTGMWQGAFSIGQFLSPIVVTLIAGAVGGVLASFQFMGFACAAAAAVALANILMHRRVAAVAA